MADLLMVATSKVKSGYVEKYEICYSYERWEWTSDDIKRFSTSINIIEEKRKLFKCLREDYKEIDYVGHKFQSRVLPMQYIEGKKKISKYHWKYTLY